MLTGNHGDYKLLQSLNNISLSCNTLSAVYCVFNLCRAIQKNKALVLLRLQ